LLAPKLVDFDLQLVALAAELFGFALQFVDLRIEEGFADNLLADVIHELENFSGGGLELAGKGIQVGALRILPDVLELEKLGDFDKFQLVVECVLIVSILVEAGAQLDIGIAEALDGFLWRFGAARLRSFQLFLKTVVFGARLDAFGLDTLEVSQGDRHWLGSANR
jgi:hypothetical protein